MLPASSPGINIPSTQHSTISHPSNKERYRGLNKMSIFDTDNNIMNGVFYDKKEIVLMDLNTYSKGV